MKGRNGLAKSGSVMGKPGCVKFYIEITSKICNK